MIDLNHLEMGMPYRELKECYIIFICTFDPFGKGMHRYTFRNTCQEDRETVLARKLDTEVEKARHNDMVRAATDSKYQEQLFAELGI